MPTTTISGKMYYTQVAYGNEILTQEFIVQFQDEPSGLESGTATIYPTRLVSGVPIVLINSNGEGVCSFSDSSGTFTFRNVQYSSYTSTKYKIIEAFGRSDGSENADWNNRTTLTDVVPKDPSLSFIASKGFEIYDATKIVSVSRNQFEITIGTNGNVTIEDDFRIPEVPYWNDVGAIPLNTIYFMDCCIKNMPMYFDEYVPIGPNLIYKGDNGTFGELPYGTIQNTSPQNSPYPDMGAFEYQSYGTFAPQDSYYSIVNIAAARTFDRRWFEIPDHTYGDERGRFMIVNG